MLQQPSQAGAGQAGAVAVSGATTVAGTGTGAAVATVATTAGTGQQQQQQQPRLVLGSLPGKLVLQGSQLAALTQARAGQAGAQPKVLTIQLQVQQQPNQQGAKVGVRAAGQVNSSLHDFFFFSI